MNDYLTNLCNNMRIILSNNFNHSIVFHAASKRIEIRFHVVSFNIDVLYFFDITRQIIIYVLLTYYDVMGFLC